MVSLYFPGFGLGLLGLPPIICVQYYFNKRRPFALGISLTGHTLGTLTILPLLQLAVDSVGWRNAAVLHAGESESTADDILVRTYMYNSSSKAEAQLILL